MDFSKSSQEKVLDFIRSWAEKEPQIQRVILFGSRARDDSSERSDYDIAVDVPKMTDAQWSRLALELREKIPTLCGLDLIRIGPDSSQDLLNRIRKEGSEIYAKK